MKLCILFIMFFLHIYDDFHLQGIMASMKQKSWWREQTKSIKYSKDYIMPLFEHAFSWSFMITLPWLVMAFTNMNDKYFTLLPIFYFINTIIHAVVDNEKANRLSINLIQDQTIHFTQIIITWGCFILIGGF